MHYWSVCSLQIMGVSAEIFLGAEMREQLFWTFWRGLHAEETTGRLFELMIFVEFMFTFFFALLLNVQVFD